MTSSARILVIDDLEGIRLSLMDYLVSEGHECQGAENGEVGLEKIRDWDPDLIFLDVHMPKVNGLQVVRAIRKEDRRTPVIIITAYDEDDVARELILAGATDFIRKPWNFEYLKRMVDSCLESG